MKDNPPICENCYFYKERWFNEAFCKKYANYKIDELVSRKTERISCRDARYSHNKCGEEGKGFLNRERIKQNQTNGG